MSSLQKFPKRIRRAVMRLLRNMLRSKELVARDVEALRQFLRGIPGMIDVDRCASHYLIAASQTIEGSIVEIGVWQGRNSIALAAACRDSANGRLIGVDPFTGNPGKEMKYGKGSIRAKFSTNIQSAGLTDFVQVIGKKSEDANIHEPIRMVFIDGDHSEAAVQADLERWSDALSQDGLILLDDFSADAPGVVAATEKFLSNNKQFRLLSRIGKTAVIKNFGV